MSEANGVNQQSKAEVLAGLEAELQHAQEELGLCEYIDSYPACERCRAKWLRTVAAIDKLIEELENA